MKQGTKLTLRCKKCGRAFKQSGSLARHTEDHRRADAEYRRQTR